MPDWTHWMNNYRWRRVPHPWLQKLGPGGFNYIPAKMKHQAWTSEGSVVFITVDGPWDVNWVADPPRKTDLGQAPPAGSR
jgi:hypothetical protein